MKNQAMDKQQTQTQKGEGKEFRRVRKMRNQPMFLEMLYGLTAHNFVSSHALFLYAPSKPTVSHFLTEAEANKYICSTSFSEKHLYKKYITKIYRITDEGIKYLAQNSPDDSWLHSIPDSEHYALHERAEEKRYVSDRIVSFVHQSDIAIMMECAGVSTPPTFLAQTVYNLQPGDQAAVVDIDEADVEDNYSGDTGDTENDCEGDFVLDFDDDDNDSDAQLFAPVFLSLLRQNATSEQNRNGLYYLTPIQDSVFTPATYIKGANYINHYKERKFITYRYAGLLETPFNSVMVIHGSKVGMKWKPSIAKNTFLQINAFISRYGLHSQKIPEQEVLMFVNNAKMFYDLYTDKAKVRNKRDWLGEDMKHFYVLPMDNDGKEMLKEFVKTGVEEHENNSIESAIDSGCYRRNNDKDSWLFPLETTDDNTPVFIGTYIDLVKIHRISSNPRDYAILCYPWQTDYYKRILPNVKLLETKM